MAGHMQINKIAARRAALIDLLADGRPHPREEIWETIATQLETDCRGKVPQEALARDLDTLRRGGIRIAYSRRPETLGYYLKYPQLKRPSSPQYETISWELIDAIGDLSVAEKNKRAFAVADFALRQKKLLLREANPDWSDFKVGSAGHLNKNLRFRRVAYCIIEAHFENYPPEKTAPFCMNASAKPIYLEI